ncbi:MAG TPA: D-sedoheptulose 7-phosphate isomerase [Candidatus Cloacimonadota bacterium]|nr:D-sedoheptulose 7-phosphate isomerase [Candidatus Cloacimonadota bacterium]HQB40112.1 D-sedoheptulose 7-phosphate isomerase [Candidatus Cloacimonadota bacterium]
MNMHYNNANTLMGLLKEFYENEENLNTITKISKSLAFCFESGKKALIAGNGGSACDAMHFAEEFTGRYRKNRKALPAISLTDSSHITCVGNDFGFDYIFSRAVEAYGKEDDFFIGISTSGNSENIIKAIEEAKSKQMITLALLGKDGGKIKGMCDYELIIPGETSDRIQEIHMLILHSIIEEVERILFPELY